MKTTIFKEIIMDLNKVINLCKKAKRFVVFRQNAKTQWLGDDVAAYLKDE